MFNPATAPYAENWLNPFKAAAASFGVQAIAAPVQDTSELESVLAALAGEPSGGLIVMPDTFTTVRGAEITALAARHRLPAVYPFRFFAASGGLLSYGTDVVHDFRRAATYADRGLDFLGGELGLVTSDCNEAAARRTERLENLSYFNVCVRSQRLSLPRDKSSKCGGWRLEKRFKINPLQEPH